ncbi:MAG: TetR/AcrR family transcriptional regulator [Rhodobacteraceae bacterium]|nr:TetR/AcrR family transcriptional regulator [Paracoccaceae bacterium]
MKKKPAPYHHGDLRNAIVVRASKIVQEDGADALSLRACARQIGVDASAVYRHFKSKNDILLEIARTAFARLATQMELAESKVPTQNPHDALLAIGVAYVFFARANPHIFDMMFALAAKNCMADVEGKSPNGKNPAEILHAAWGRVLIANGRSKNSDDSFPLLLWGTVHGLSNLINQGLGLQDETAVKTAVESACKSMISGRLSEPT